MLSCGNLRISVTSRRTYIPFILAVCVFSARPVAYASTPQPGSADSGNHQLHIPNRSAMPLFQGQQGKQRTEISFDPQSDVVTLKMLVQDPSGYFIPNIRRENFTVYEDGIRQQNATVEIEHAPVSVGILVEYGGRYRALSTALGDEVARAAHSFEDEIGKEDKIAIWKYGDSIETVSDFSRPHDTLQSALDTLATPPLSELNFYDALVAALGRMRPISGRNALVLISSGLDTFSKATYEDALRAASDSDVPVYVVNVGPSLQQAISIFGNSGPYARLDWKGAESKLQAIARASGGRMYSPRSTMDLASIYDDIIENLRVRYVITYKSAATKNPTLARNVRVELVDPKTGGPLEIVDATGKPVNSKIFVEDTYVPHSASAASLNTTLKVQPE